jgi:hypothetical protein
MVRRGQYRSTSAEGDGLKISSSFEACIGVHR